MDWSAVYGAQDDSLDKLLARGQVQNSTLFKVAQELQRRKEAERQDSLAARQVDLQAENARESRAFREMQQQSLDADRKERNIDRDEARKSADTQKFLNSLPLRKKGSVVTPQEQVRFVQEGLTGETTAAGSDEHMADPHFHFAGTPADETAQARLGDSDARQAEIERHNQEMERIAAMNAGRMASGPVVKIATVDENGRPITQLVSRDGSVKGEFVAPPTTDTRNREAASRRSSAVLSAISELSEKINTGQGLAARAQGEVEKAKAAANLNDDVSEYNGVVSGFTPLLARALGHTGVLTEQDVQSVREALPKPTDSKSVRDRKVKRIMSLMDAMNGSSPAPSAAPGGAPATPSVPANDAAAKAAELLKKYGGG